MVNTIPKYYNIQIFTSRPRPFEISEFTFKMKLNCKVFQHAPFV
jgi:hypothetical protein